MFHDYSFHNIILFLDLSLIGMCTILDRTGMRMFECEEGREDHVRRLEVLILAFLFRQLSTVPQLPLSCRFMKI